MRWPTEAGAIIFPGCIETPIAAKDPPERPMESTGSGGPARESPQWEKEATIISHSQLLEAFPGDYKVSDVGGDTKTNVELMDLNLVLMPIPWTAPNLVAQAQQVAEVAMNMHTDNLLQIIIPPARKWPRPAVFLFVFGCGTEVARPVLEGLRKLAPHNTWDEEEHPVIYEDLKKMDDYIIEIIMQSEYRNNIPLPRGQVPTARSALTRWPALRTDRGREFKMIPVEKEIQGSGEASNLKKTIQIYEIREDPPPTGGPSAAIQGVPSDQTGSSLTEQKAAHLALVRDQLTANALPPSESAAATEGSGSTEVARYQAAGVATPPVDPAGREATGGDTGDTPVADAGAPPTGAAASGNWSANLLTWVGPDLRDALNLVHNTERALAGLSETPEGGANSGRTGDQQRSEHQATTAEAAAAAAELRMRAEGGNGTGAATQAPADLAGTQQRSEQQIEMEYALASAAEAAVAAEEMRNNAGTEGGGEAATTAPSNPVDPAPMLPPVPSVPIGTRPDDRVTRIAAAVARDVATAAVHHVTSSSESSPCTSLSTTPPGSPQRQAANPAGAPAAPSTPLDTLRTFVAQYNLPPEVMDSMVDQRCRNPQDLITLPYSDVTLLAGPMPSLVQIDQVWEAISQMAGYSADRERYPRLEAFVREKRLTNQIRDSLAVAGVLGSEGALVLGWHQLMRICMSGSPDYPHRASKTDFPYVWKAVKQDQELLPFAGGTAVPPVGLHARDYTINRIPPRAWDTPDWGRGAAEKFRDAFLTGGEGDYCWIFQVIRNRHLVLRDDPFQGKPYQDPDSQDDELWLMPGTLVCADRIYWKRGYLSAHILSYQKDVHSPVVTCSPQVEALEFRSGTPASQRAGHCYANLMSVFSMDGRTFRHDWGNWYSRGIQAGPLTQGDLMDQLGRRVVNHWTFSVRVYSEGLERAARIAQAAAEAEQNGTRMGMATTPRPTLWSATVGAAASTRPDQINWQASVSAIALVEITVAFGPDLTRSGTEMLTRQIVGQATCACCMDPLINGEAINTLHCTHPFRQDCIEEWLRTKGEEAPCPLCKMTQQQVKERTSEVERESILTEIAANRRRLGKIALHQEVAANTMIASHPLALAILAAMGKMFPEGIEPDDESPPNHPLRHHAYRAIILYVEHLVTRKAIAEEPLSNEMMGYVEYWARARTIGYLTDAQVLPYPHPAADFPVSFGTFRVTKAHLAAMPKINVAEFSYPRAPPVPATKQGVNAVVLAITALSFQSVTGANHLLEGDYLAGVVGYNRNPHPDTGEIVTYDPQAVNADGIPVPPGNPEAQARSLQTWRDAIQRAITTYGETHQDKLSFYLKTICMGHHDERGAQPEDASPDTGCITFLAFQNGMSMCAAMHLIQEDLQRAWVAATARASNATGANPGAEREETRNEATRVMGERTLLHQNWPDPATTIDADGVSEEWSTTAMIRGEEKKLVGPLHLYRINQLSFSRFMLLTILPLRASIRMGWITVASEILSPCSLPLARANFPHETGWILGPILTSLFQDSFHYGRDPLHEEEDQLMEWPAAPPPPSDGEEDEAELVEDASDGDDEASEQGEPPPGTARPAQQSSLPPAEGAQGSGDGQRTSGRTRTRTCRGHCAHKNTAGSRCAVPCSLEPGHAGACTCVPIVVHGTRQEAAHHVYNAEKRGDSGSTYSE